MDRVTLNVAIVGLGRLGKRHALQIAQCAPGAKLIAACSPFDAELDWARSELGVSRCYQSLEGVLEDGNVDAVVLVTPTKFHAEQAVACLQAGKHVFVEKPLSLDVDECVAVEEVAKKCSNLVAMVGFVRRFDSSYVEAKCAIDRGEIGDPFFVRAQTCDRYDSSGFFVRFSASSGGIFMDCSVHDIDLARWLLGGPVAKRVFASGTIALHPGLKEFGDVDNGIAVVEFEGGKRAVFYASRTMPHGHETTTEVIGTSGIIQVGFGAHVNRVQYRDAKGVSHRVVQDFYERFRDAFQAEIRAFVAACRGEQSVPLALSDATEATRIGQAITQSLRCGMPVDL